MLLDLKRWFNSQAYADTLLRIHCHPFDPGAPSADVPTPTLTINPRGPEPATQPLGPGKHDSSSSGSGPGSKQGGETSQRIRTYHAHAVFLRGQSAYFDASLGELWHEQEHRQQQQSKKRKQQQGATPSSAPSAHTTLDLHLDPGQEDAMDLLLRSMYDHPLPAVTPDNTLLLFQCLHLADRYDVPQCVSAILITLKGSDAAAEANGVKLAVSMNAAVLRHICHAPPGITDRPDFKAFHAAAKRYMVDTYGDVPAVVRSEQLRQQFCSLPFAAVLAWAESDELRVQSENCVVYLLSTWVQAAQQGGGQGVSGEQLEQLAQQVRVLHLGPAYQHHILPQLGWFKGCKGMVHLPTLLALKGKDAAGKAVFPAEVEYPAHLRRFPAQWVAKARQQARVTDADQILGWEVGGEQLERLQWVYSLPLYLNGFMLRMMAHTDAAADGAKTLGLYVGVDPVQAEGAIPWPETAAVKAGPVDLKVLNGPEGGVRRMLSCVVWERSTGWGHPAMLSKSVPSASDLVAPYLKDGKLRVEARFTTVDKP